MPNGLESVLYSAKSGSEWIENVLPGIWEELCTSLHIRAGVIVLKSSEDDSFFESATFGYGEDGFFYSFLARGSKDWVMVQNSSQPIRFLGSDYELSKKDGIASVFRIRSDGEFVGFLIVEWDDEIHLSKEPILYLLSEKIGMELGERIPLEVGGLSLHSSPSLRPPSVVSVLPPLSLKIEALREWKTIGIFGPLGSGKKTLAKWIHQQTRPSSPCLFLSLLPENLGKLEKAIRSWSIEAGTGTLVFLGAKKWTLGQQKIITDWVTEGGFSSQIFFLDGVEENSETLPGFSKILRKNPIQIPGFDFFEKPILRNIVTSLFYELSQEQNRNGLELGAGTIDDILDRNFPGNFSDLKNLLLGAILRSKSGQIKKGDLGNQSFSLDLEVPDAEDLDLRRGIQALERQKILIAIRIFSGNQIRMAKALGISRGALQYKMKQLGLP